MLRLSLNLFLFGFFVSLATFSSFWTLPLLSLKATEANPGLVLGASSGRGIRVRVLSEAGKVFEVVAEAYGGQKTVYKEFSFLKNPSPDLKRFVVKDVRVERPENIDGVSLYWGDRLPSKDIFLEGGDSLSLSLEIVAREEAPPVFPLKLLFSIEEN